MSSDLENFNAAMEARARARLHCTYDTSKGYSMREGLGCIGGLVTRKVTIIYNPGVYGREEVYTCEACFKTLKRLVRRQGYKLRSEKI